MPLFFFSTRMVWMKGLCKGGPVAERVLLAIFVKSCMALIANTVCKQYNVQKRLSCSLLVRVLVASCKKLNYIYRMDALVHWSSAQLLHDVSHLSLFIVYSF